MAVGAIRTLWLLEIRCVMKQCAELVVFESIAPNDADIEEFGKEGIDCNDGTYGGGGGGAGGSEAF